MGTRDSLKRDERVPKVKGKGQGKSRSGWGPGDGLEKKKPEAAEDRTRWDTMFHTTKGTMKVKSFKSKTK